jgi:hypothetical protein
VTEGWGNVFTGRLSLGFGGVVETDGLGFWLCETGFLLLQAAKKTVEIKNKERYFRRDCMDEIRTGSIF